MGGVSPVLYRPVVPARLVKISADAQFSAPAQIFTISCENSKILSRLLSVLSLPRKFVYDHCCWPNSTIILTVLKMEAILEFGRGCQNLSIILWGGGGGGALPQPYNPDNIAAGGATDARRGKGGGEGGLALIAGHVCLSPFCFQLSFHFSSSMFPSLISGWL